MRRGAATALICALTLTPAPLGARPAQAPPAVTTPTGPPPPPFELQLLRLEEALGALSYLRDLCAERDAPQWRARATALLEAEGATEARRERMTVAFNEGFRGFERAYRVCTDNARLAAQRYMDEAARLAHDVVWRYGEP